MSKRRVVISILGSVLDSGPFTSEARWERWRPNVCLCQHEEFLVNRFELLYEKQFKRLADVVKADIATCSPETEVVLREITFGDPWDFEQVYSSLHDFGRQYPFDPDQEEYLLHITTGTHVCQICLFLLAESRHFPGQLLQTSPPPRGKSGPGSYRIIDLDLSRYDRIAQRFAVEQKEGLSFLKAGIQTRNKAFNQIVEQIEHVAIHSPDPVLLMGPTGAGKSKLARRMYDLKKQRRQVEGPFVEVNCATLRGDSAMSTLFGHKRGAYTGATTDRPGLLRAANNGVLFLDEIGELGTDEQTMLLRALEEKRFLPLGSDREVESSFQLIAGTNRDLQSDVRQGRFRDDLLARINLWTYHLPGLAQRKEDIEPNIRFELEQFAARTGSSVRFNTEAWEAYLDFAISSQAAWLGNFRDLSSSITRLATLCRGGRITRDLVQSEIEHLQRSWSTPTELSSGDQFLEELLGPKRVKELDLFDRLQLAQVVTICRQSPSLAVAGRQLFAVSRQKRSSINDADRIRKYLAKFDIQWSDIHH